MIGDQLKVIGAHSHREGLVFVLLRIGGMKYAADKADEISPSHQRTSSGVASSTFRSRTSTPRRPSAPSATSPAIFAVLPLAESYTTSTLPILSFPPTVPGRIRLAPDDGWMLRSDRQARPSLDPQHASGRACHAVLNAPGHNRRWIRRHSSSRTGP